MVIYWVGDIFDLWVGRFPHFIKEYEQLIDALKALAERNVRVIYFQGNHDLYLEDFWAKELGFEVYREPQSFDLMGTKFFVEHGDLMNPNDKGYFLLKRVLNHPLVELGIKKLPNSWVKVIGEKMSRTSRESRAPKPQNEEAIRQMIRDNALRRHQQYGAQIVVTGHVHILDEWTSPGEEVRSVNLGSWHEQPRVWCWSPSGSEWLFAP